MTTAAEYYDWLVDPVNNQHRLLLIELDHSDGTIYLATDAWISDSNTIYDDWLTSLPYIESSIGSAADLGDIDAVNPDLSVDWLNYSFRGRRCRWFHGDRRWLKSDFYQVATCTIQGIRCTGDRQYRFELTSDSQRYDRTFYSGADTVRTENIDAAITWILGQYTGSGPHEFINIDAGALSKSVTYNVTESSVMIDLLRLIAKGIDASVRITQTGLLQFIVPDRDSAAVQTFTEDSIVHGSIKQVDVVPAYARLTVTYANDGKLTGSTGADTATLDEERTIDTALTNQSDAQALLDSLSPRYAKTQSTWSFDDVLLGQTVQPGDYVTVQHPEIAISGIVSRKSSNSTLKTTLEIAA